MDESSTANILLCLSSTRSDDSSEESSSPSFSSPEMGTNYEGDIVDQLKHTVRAESASGKRKSGICDLDMNSGEDQFPTKARRDSDVSETMSEVDEYDKIRYCSNLHLLAIWH